MQTYFASLRYYLLSQKSIIDEDNGGRGNVAPKQGSEFVVFKVAVLLKRFVITFRHLRHRLYVRKQINLPPCSSYFLMFLQLQQAVSYCMGKIQCVRMRTFV